jgi:hypothetical protein
MNLCYCQNEDFEDYMDPPFEDLIEENRNIPSQCPGQIIPYLYFYFSSSNKKCCCCGSKNILIRWNIKSETDDYLNIINKKNYLMLGKKGVCLKCLEKIKDIPHSTRDYHIINNCVGVTTASLEDLKKIFNNINLKEEYKSIILYSGECHLEKEISYCDCQEFSCFTTFVSQLLENRSLINPNNNLLFISTE